MFKAAILLLETKIKSCVSRTNLSYLGNLGWAGALQVGIFFGPFCLNTVVTGLEYDNCEIKYFYGFIF